MSAQAASPGAGSRVEARPSWRRRAAALVVTMARSIAAHRIPAVAGESAFFAALAVFPALLSVVAVVQAAQPVLGPGAEDAAVSGLTDLLRVVLTTRGGAAADAAAGLLGGKDHALLGLGTGVALLLLMRMLRSLLHALAPVAERRRRRVWPSALGLAAATLVLGAVVIALAVLDPLRVSGLPAGRAIWSVARWPATVLALVAWASLLLRVGLGRRCGRHLLIGGVVVAVGWVLASLVFPLYVLLATRFTSTLGALGGSLILLVWLYLLVLVLLVGAELCVALRAPAPATGGN